MPPLNVMSMLLWHWRAMLPPLGGSRPDQSRPAREADMQLSPERNARGQQSPESRAGAHLAGASRGPRCENESDLGTTSAGKGVTDGRTNPGS